MGGWRLTVLTLGLVFWAPSQTLGAQDLSTLIAACGGGSEVGLAWCQEIGLAVQAAQGALGLASSGGSDIPGSASTLGWRMKGSPRIALSVRGSFTRAPTPALDVREGLPGGQTTANLPSIHLTGSVGVFDGFSLGPTVGGFGSVDLAVATHWVRTPRDQGFQENPTGWGIGARVGILRESFSLPGISLSAFHRSLGNIDLWNMDEGDPAEGSFDLRVSSLRGVVGKDLWGLGFFGGAGWERYSGDMTLLAADPGDTSIVFTGSGELESERLLFFVGGSMTFLTLQISAEIGLAEGFDPTLPLPTGGGFDPTSRSEFGALAFRLTF